MANTLLCDKPGSLIIETKKLLNKEPAGLLTTAGRTGVPFYWLKKFKAGKIPNPSVNRVQFLFESLAGKKVVSK